MESSEKTKEQLKEDLRKTREELAVQKWGIEKTLEGMKVLVKELIQKGKEAEEAIAKDEAILASIGDGIIATDQNARVILMNEACEKLMGWKKEETIGKSWFEIAPMEDEKGNTISDDKSPIQQAISSKKSTINTFYFVRKDKTKFPVAVTATPIILNGKVIGAIGVYRDITHEKEIDKAKTEFVSLASHQLRTPLTSINWYIEMLQSGDAGVLNDKQKEFLFEVYKGSRRMIGLINDLLNVSRLETGQLKIEPVPTDLIAFIQDMLKEFEPLAKEKGCKIQFELPKREIEKINVDQILLRQVMSNLLTNAIQYSSVKNKGQVKISLVVSPQGYTINVKDNGIGIPKEAQGRIFEKLFRGDNAREVISDGTGLGLYLTKQIIDASGGSIGFSSEPGQETTFYVTIPISGMISKTGKKGLEE